MLLLAKQTIDLLDDFLTNIKSVGLENLEEQLVCIVTWGLFNKALRTYKAILILAEHGFSPEAHTLLRVLSEATVKIVFILRDPNQSSEPAKKYFALQYILDEKIPNAWESNPNLTDSAPQLKTLVEKNISEIKEMLGDDLVDNVREKGWAGFGKRGDIEKIFNKVIPNAYDTLFRATSRNVHCNDLTEYIKNIPEGGWEMLSGDNKNWNSGCLRLGALFMLHALTLICKYFIIDDPSGKEPLITIIEEFKECRE